MQRKLITAALLCCSAIAANAPAISTEQRAKFWRAQAEYIAASVQLQKAKSTIDSVQAELAKSCGDWQLVGDKDGEPTCQPKPEAPKK